MQKYAVWEYYDLHLALYQVQGSYWGRKEFSSLSLLTQAADDKKNTVFKPFKITAYKNWSRSNGSRYLSQNVS